MAASARLGFPEGTIVGMGILLLARTALYVLPRTSIFGAILLTGYLGEAVATQVRFGHTLLETLFPVIFGGIVWAGVFLRDARLRTLVPLRE